MNRARLVLIAVATLAALTVPPAHAASCPPPDCEISGVLRGAATRPDPLTFSWQGSFTGHIVRVAAGDHPGQIGGPDPVPRTYAFSASGWLRRTDVVSFTCTNQPCVGASVFTGGGTLSILAGSSTVEVPVRVTMTGDAWAFRQTGPITLREPAGHSGFFLPTVSSATPAAGVTPVYEGAITPGPSAPAVCLSALGGCT